MEGEWLEIDGKPFVRISRFGVARDHPEDGGGGGASDAHYRHVQSAASSQWLITHNLGKRPGVTVVDTSGRRVFGGVFYVDENSLSLTFSAPFSGECYLN